MNRAKKMTTWLAKTVKKNQGHQRTKIAITMIVLTLI